MQYLIHDTIYNIPFSDRQQIAIIVCPNNPIYKWHLLKAPEAVLFCAWYLWWTRFVVLAYEFCIGWQKLAHDVHDVDDIFWCFYVVTGFEVWSWWL